MPITPRTLRLAADLAADLAAVTDQQVRDLTGAWVDAWDEVAPDLQAALLDIAATVDADEVISRGQLLRSRRLLAVLTQISDTLDELATQAQVTISSDLAAVVQAAADAQAALLGSQLPAGSDLIDPARAVADAALDAIVARSTQQINSLATPVAPETYQVIRRELIRGVAAGASPRQTAARMVQRAEDRFNFGLTRALVIARTETVTAHREAATESQAVHADVLAGWIWLAKLDARTCRSCWAQHGRLHELDEPGPYDHQQGRCARMPKTKTWADLGIALDEPADATPDAAAMFLELPDSEKQQILGKNGFTAWQDGRFPMDAWSQLRKSDGWRDSYGVAPAPKAARRGAA